MPVGSCDSWAGPRPFAHAGTQEFNPWRNCQGSRRSLKWMGRGEKFELTGGRKMYTGSLIDDLMTAVERVEEGALKHIDATLVEPWQLCAAYELPSADLFGVA